MINPLNQIDSSIHCNAPYSRKSIQKAYSMLAFQQRPTALLTLTVKEPKGKHGGWLVSDSKLLSSANLLLRWVNAELYGRKFQKRGLGLEGFGSLEKQSNSQPHIHLAITSAMPPKRFTKMKSSILSKIEKLPLFEKSGIDVQLIGNSDADSWRVGNYVAKEGNMLTLTGGGIA